MHLNYLAYKWAHNFNKRSQTAPGATVTPSPYVILEPKNLIQCKNFAAILLCLFLLTYMPYVCHLIVRLPHRSHRNPSKSFIYSHEYALFEQAIGAKQLENENNCISVLLTAKMCRMWICICLGSNRSSPKKKRKISLKNFTGFLYSKIKNQTKCQQIAKW